MAPITKRMSHLSAISRGLDKTNPEHLHKSRQELAQKLRRVIASVSELEADHDENLNTLATIRSLAFDLINLAHAPVFDRAELESVAIDLIECLEVGI